MSEVINIKELNERIERESVFVDTLNMEMGKVIVGQKHLVDTLLIGLLSNGHILLEGVPGLAKTLAMNRETYRRYPPEQNWLSDLIQTLLVDEMFRRRCRRRNCQKWSQKA